MKKMSHLLENSGMQAFEKAGFDSKYGKVSLSDRPDLCDYQCNGALTAAKEYKRAPFMIADEVVKNIENEMIKKVEMVKPGFINITLSEKFLSEYCQKMIECNKLGFEEIKGRKIVLDYGGPNIAKPLHVGHLRPAVIGECIKRIHKYVGDEVIGDVHLGDWGLQMGLIIEELKVRKPDLPYFDENYKGDYPEEPPFTIDELEEIYPAASKKTKVEDNATAEEIEFAEEFKESARKNTGLLQQQKRGYYDLWKQIVAVSLEDLKKNYEKLNVNFDLWLGESDSQKYVPEMIKMMEDRKIIYESDGAMVVDVQEPTDNTKINPCMILKRGGVSCYQTTDLATLLQRKKEFNPDEVIYVVDKRQDMHFVQVFRCAKKADLINSNTVLTFLGFGTINGKDGKPFKTRAGGVMRLEKLIDEVNKKIYDKLAENKEMSEKEKNEISKIVGLAALKYADLSNQISKDYIFDIDKFTSLEGDTGPYILYTIVRIKSIIKKYKENNPNFVKGKITIPSSNVERNIMLLISQFNQTIEQAYSENAPYKICVYLYKLATEFNLFYNSTKILKEEKAEAEAHIELITLVKEVLEIGIDLLGFSAPEKM